MEAAVRPWPRPLLYLVVLTCAWTTCQAARFHQPFQVISRSQLGTDIDEAYHVSEELLARRLRTYCKPLKLV